ncbi:MAG: hypothetical protein ACI4GZ_03575 [Ruminococcus sp.]
MFGKKKKLLGVNIVPSCDYCQNCIVEGGKNFCIKRKSINKKGKCSRFDYNPVMRKIPKTPSIGKYDESDFIL